MTDTHKDSNVTKDYKVPYGSNSIRLSGWEWIVVGIVCSLVFCFGPSLWGRLDELKAGADYRLPYKVSSDYWLYNRYCRWACSRYETLVVGDSVIWGHYVPRDRTLSHYLNQNAGQDQFVNLGVDGSHPAALGGLLRYYGRNISGKNVILHLNPLWMSDKKQDLQTEKEYRFHHPKLVPQFTPKIPCYKDAYAKRVSIVVERKVPFLGWTSHLRTAYFENVDMPTWTTEHPYDNPLRAVTLRLPVSQEDNPKDDATWIQRGTTIRNFQWVELETSLQWILFRQTIELLKARKNTVFVLVGPFNEHMLKTESLNVYQEMKSEIESWLRQNNVAYFVPPALPSEFYSDASHPLAEGYAMLAKQLFENQSFRSAILHVE
jgi:hypothetical protein